MGKVPTKFLIDGIDRLGKSSLTKLIMRELGYHMVIHFDKPKVLENHLIDAEMIQAAEPDQIDYVNLQGLSLDNIARFLYQEAANRTMFDLMKTDVPLIFDRTHLGEMVYAPLYREYSGDYVLDIEKEFVNEKMFTQESNVRLILLTSSNTDMLLDDGLSFDPTKKNEEQEMFIKAFNRSQLTNKVMIDVHDGNGGYRSYKDILEEALYKSCK